MPLIIGGGPAGAAAAIRLAKGGMSPILVERSPSPADMLCGGFLSWNSLRLLRRCNIDPIALGGHPVHRARLFAQGRMVEMALPGLATGLSRQRLDQTLLDRAAQAGADVRRGVTVRAVEGGVVRYADGTTDAPRHLILATGKHDLRGAARSGHSSDAAIGLRWRFQSSDALIRAISGAIELHMFRNGYAGLVLQEDGAANLCLAVRRSGFVKAGANPGALLAMLVGDNPALADRLADTVQGEAQAVANIPYGWRARGHAQRLYRVGDQIGVIPSLAGEGVGIAIATGIAAADAILAGIGPQAYQDRCARRIATPIGWASALWWLAERPGVARISLPLLAHLPGLAAAAMRMTRIN